MIPTIGSRLAASAVAFLLGCGAANVGIVAIPGPDRVAWLIAAGVLVATAGAGVTFADTRRPLSIWALLGVEAFAAFTVLPLLWLFRLATTPRGDDPTSLLPHAVEWANFGKALDASGIDAAMAHSLLASLLATIVAVPVGFLAAATLVRRQPPGHRGVRRWLVAVVLAPLLVWTVPMSAQARELGLLDSPWITGVGLLVVAVPLATWLSVVLCEQARWGVVEAVRSAGASPRELRRLALIPQFAPGIAAVAVATFAAGCLDFVVGSAVTATRGPLAITLLGRHDLSLTAAVGLVWLVLTGGLVALIAPVLLRLVGRS